MIADQVRSAYERRDLDALAGLLADDVTWGPGGDPRSCHDRSEVIATYRRLMETGVTAEVVSVSAVPAGVVVHLRLADQDRWQLLVVRDARIMEIRGYDDGEPDEQAANSS